MKNIALVIFVKSATFFKNRVGALILPIFEFSKSRKYIFEKMMDFFKNGVGALILPIFDIFTKIVKSIRFFQPINFP